jgi:hypothetical protein
MRLSVLLLKLLLQRFVKHTLISPPPPSPLTFLPIPLHHMDFVLRIERKMPNFSHMEITHVLLFGGGHMMNPA